MFDVKLIDGRYFSNVDVWDTSIEGFIEGVHNISCILDNKDIKMELYHCNDVDCEELLATITGNDIEYICEAYEYKKNNNKENNQIQNKSTEFSIVWKMLERIRKPEDIFISSNGKIVDYFSKTIYEFNEKGNLVNTTNYKLSGVIKWW